MIKPKYFKCIFLLIFSFLPFILYAYEEIGIASWYGPNFHGKLTANGEKYNCYAYTAAHKTLPLGSVVRVLSLENNKSVIVMINDRGPFVKDRIIDLSKSAANDLDLIKKGTMNVKITLLKKGDNSYHRYSNTNYKIQIASFSDIENANKFLLKYSRKIKKLSRKKITIKKNGKISYLYRIIIDDINYYELQLYKVELIKNNIIKFLVIKK